MKKTKKKNNLIKFITFSLLLIPIVGVAVKLNESSPGNKPIINVPVKNENVTVEVLVKICTALDCNIEDIMELVPDEKQAI